MIRLIFIVIILFTSLISSETKKLKVVYPKNFPPSYVVVNGEHSGYGLELFKEIKNDLNLNVEYLPQESWKDVFKLMESGEADIIPNQGITEYRKKFMNYSQEVQSINVALYSLKGKKVLGTESLKGKKVGVIRANVAFKILKRYKNIDIKIFDDQDHFFDDFIDGDLDFIAYTQPAIISLAKQKGVLKDIEKNFDLIVIHRGIAVHKDKIELLNNINTTINKLKNNGKLKEIYSKWHKEEKTYSQSEILKIFGYLLIIPIVLFIYLNYKKIILTRNELEKELEKKTALLKESKEKLEFAVENVLNGYWEWNLTTNEINCSDSWFETLKLDKNSFKPSLETIFEIIHDDDKKDNEIAIKRVLDEIDKSFSLEFRFKVEEKYLWVHALGTIYQKENKEKIFFGVILDINDAKKLEEQKVEQENMIFHQSKMAAMGEMLENIAHQWRQPLSMISTSATGISFQKEIGVLEDKYLEEAMKNINDATQYLSHTIDDFRNYFKSDKYPKEFDISLVTQRVVRILSSKFKNSGIKIMNNMKEEHIINLENEFVQVLINILNNAKDALECLELENKCIFIESRKEKDIICIEIKDNAGGIEENIVEKIFDPYFTTKHQSQGTGLGLYMCNEILTKHMNSTINVKNIQFECENNIYKGAQFTIKLKSL